MDPLSAGLQAIVGARHCLTEPTDKAPYLTDWRGLYRGEVRAPTAAAGSSSSA